ncbi:MAG: hypothetical protein NVS3B25_31360 [Hymenobacter sp.]
MSRSPLEFLCHIQDELDFLERYRSLPDLADVVANPEAARARDKIVHHYFDVNYSIVWNVLQNELKPLRQTVELMLRDLT